jgi:hypothetical protein
MDEQDRIVRTEMSKKQITTESKKERQATRLAEDILTKMQNEAAESQREKIIDNMTPQFREKLEYFKNWYRNEASHSLRCRYELGLQVMELYDDEKNNNGNTYGRNAIGHVCKLLRWEDDLIRMALRFAKIYSKEELEQLCTKTLPSGEPLSWSHVRTLIPVTDAKQRQELLDKAVKEGLTCMELAQEVKNLMDRPSVDGRGRPPRQPKDFDTAVAQQKKHCGDWDRRYFKVWAPEDKSLVAHAAKLAPNEITEDHLRQARELANELRRVADQANDQADKADQVVKTFEHILEDRKEKTPADPEGSPARKNSTKRRSDEAVGKSL